MYLCYGGDMETYVQYFVFNPTATFFFVFILYMILRLRWVMNIIMWPDKLLSLIGITCNALRVAQVVNVNPVHHPASFAHRPRM